MSRKFRSTFQRRSEEAPPENQQFSGFSASELYCPNCKQAMPVREKMLLVLSDGDLYDYVCTTCGTSLGTRTEKASSKIR